MNRKILGIIFTLLATSSTIVLSTANAIDTRECLETLKPDIVRLTKYSRNVDAKKIGSKIYIRQIVPFISKHAYGEKLDTLVIDCDAIGITRDPERYAIIRIP